MSLKVYKSSAGSGKTYTLVLEYLSLVLAKPSKFRNILGVTFTNKAANEMKARVLAALWLLAKPEADREGQRNDLLKNIIAKTNLNEATIGENASMVFYTILHNYSEFNISTIDSFSHKLVRTFTRDLNLPPQFEVELNITNLSSQVADILLSKVGVDPFIGDTILSFVLQKMDDETDWQVERDLRKYCEKLLSEEAFFHLKGGYSLSKEDFSAVKKQLRDELDSTEKRFIGIGKSMSSLLDSCQIHPNQLFGGPKGISSILNKIHQKKIIEVFISPTYKKLASREIEFISQKTEKGVRQKFAKIEGAMWENVRLLNEIFLNDFPRYVLLSLLKRNIHGSALQMQMLEVIREIGVEKQMVHISEFNRSIANLLHNAAVPFIYERLGERYQHFLLDEFQDTSVLQWQNFLPLIENSLANGNLNLIVGDGKQSIYRFRSGEVEQFLLLPKIFRANNQEALLRMEQLLKQSYIPFNLDTNYRSSSEIVALNNEFFDFVKHKLPSNLQDVYSNQSQKSNKNNGQGYSSFIFVEKDKKKEETARKQLDQTLELVRNLTNEGYKYEDIAILVRAKEKGNNIACHLANNGIGVVSADSLLLNASTKVRLIVSALRFLVQPDDKINRTELIKNYFDVTEQNSTKLLADTLIKFYQLNENEQISAVAKLVGIRTYDGFGRSVYDLAEHLVRAFNLHQEVDPYVQFFLDEAYRFQVQERKGPAEFLTYWQITSEKMSIIVPENTDAVKVMTIHKAKGLEFKVVIFAFADTGLKQNTKKEFWLDLQNENLGKIKSGMVSSSKDLKHTSFGWMYDEESGKTMLDLLNLLYVAMTRAKERLYIISQLPIASKSERIDFSFPSFFKEFLVHKNLWNDNQCIYSIGTPASPVSELATRDEIKSSNDFISSDWHERMCVVKEFSSLLNDTANDAINWGNLAHLVLSEIKYQSEAAFILNKYLENGLLTEVQLKRMNAQLMPIFNHPKLSACFSDEVIVKNEVEIMDQRGRLYRIDRYNELHDKVVLVDYKTGKKSETHHVQMLNYRSLVSELVPKPIECLLVYLGNTVEVVEAASFS